MPETLMPRKENSSTPEEWQIRATANELLAFSFRYPSAELADALISGEWLDAACEIAAASNARLPKAFGSEGLTLDKNGKDVPNAEVLEHTLCAEATRLFIGAPDPVVSPFEGIWRAEDDGVQGLLFANPHSMDVERFFKSCGLVHPEGTNEPLDHIATELEALQYLAGLAAHLDDPEIEKWAASLPGGSPSAAYDQFMSEHVSVWALRFAQKVQEETRLPYYRAAAQLLAAFMA